MALLEKGEKIADGSRSICQAKRTLEISDRLGVGERLRDRGVSFGPISTSRVAGERSIPETRLGDRYGAGSLDRDRGMTGLDLSPRFYDGDVFYAALSEALEGGDPALDFEVPAVLDSALEPCLRPR